MKRYVKASIDKKTILTLLDNPECTYKIYVNDWNESKSYAAELLSQSGATLSDIDRLKEGEEIQLGENTFYVDYDRIF